MGRKILRYDELRASGIPWTRTHLTRLEREGKFPHRVHLGPMTVGWLADEVERFLTKKAADRPLQLQIDTVE